MSKLLNYIGLLLLMIISTSYLAESATPPSTQAKYVAFSNITSSQVQVSWFRGNGAARLVVVSTNPSTTFTPVNGSTYTANTNFSAGTDLDDDDEHITKAAFISTSTLRTFNLTGLSPNTEYTVRVYEYNNGGSPTPAYQTSDAVNNPMTFKTQIAAPTLYATTGIMARLATLNWQEINNVDGYVINVFSDADGDGDLSAPVLTADPIYSDLDLGAITASPSGTVSFDLMDLLEGTDYTYQVKVYDGGSTSAYSATTSNFSAGAWTTTVDGDDPQFTIEYFADDNFEVSLGSDPRLKVGTYYLKITSDEELTSGPDIYVDADGGTDFGNSNGINNNPVDLIQTGATEWMITRSIVDDARNGGTRENWVIGGTDLSSNSGTMNPTNQNTNGAFVDTEEPEVSTTRDAITLGSNFVTTDNNISFTIDFDEQVDFNGSNLTIHTSGSATYSSSSTVTDNLSDGEYSLDISGVDGDGLLWITIDTDVMDRADNNMLATHTSASFTIDNTSATFDDISEVENGTGDADYYVDMDFSENIYADQVGNGEFNEDSFTINIAQNASLDGVTTAITSVTVTLTDNTDEDAASTADGGNDNYRIFFDRDFTPSGVEQIWITPVDNSVYDVGGNETEPSHSSATIYLPDETAPTITNIAQEGPSAYTANSYNENTSLTITFESAEAKSVDLNDYSVEVFSNGDVSLGSASAATWTGTGLNVDPYLITFTYNVPAGDYVNAKIVVDVTDNAGNNNSSTLSNAFEIDNTDPTASADAYTDLVINESISSLTVTIGFDDEMDTISYPSVTFTDSQESLTFNSDDSYWFSSSTFIAVFDVTDNNEEIDDVDLTVSGAKDLAQNTMTPYTDANVIDIDLKKPEITAMIINVSPIAEANVGLESVSFTIQFDEAMNTAEIPTLAFPGDFTSETLSSVTWTSSTTFIAAYDIADDNIELSNVSVTVTLAEDVLGNVMAPHDEMNLFEVDLVKPTVADVAYSNPYVNEVTPTNAGFVVTIEFSENMDADVDPSVTFTSVNGEATSLSFDSGSWTDSRTFTAYFDVTDDDLDLTDFAAVISDFDDLAGNTGNSDTFNGTFDIDLVAPNVSLAIFNDATLNESNTSVTITIVYNEDMDTDVDPVLAFTNPAPASLSYNAGASYWSGSSTFYSVYTVTDNNEEFVDIDLEIEDATDVAGSPQVPYNAADVLDIDLKKPEVTSFTTTANPITEANVGVNSVTFTVVFDEAMNTGVNPSIGLDLAFNSETPTTGIWTSSTTFNQLYTITDNNLTLNDIDATISGGQDEAGNTMSEDLTEDFLDVDLAKPTVIAVSYSTTNVNEALVGDDMFTVIVEFNETMNQLVAPSITFASVNGAVTSLSLGSGNWTNSTSYTATFDVTDNELEIDDAQAVISAFNDAAGNTGNSSTFVGTFDIDLNKPSVVSVDISTDNIYEGLAINSSTVTIEVVYDEAMDETSTPSITFTDNAQTSLVFDSGEWNTSTTYSAYYTVNDDNVDVEDIDATVSGALDLAGNTQEEFDQNNLFDIDLVKPTVINYVVNTDLINEDYVGAATVTFTVEFSEAMETAVVPDLTFEPAFTSSVINSGSWNGSTSYTFVYDIIDDNLETSQVSLTITDAQDVAGNILDDHEINDIFDVDLKKPEIDAVVFNINLINESNVGENEFSITIEFDEDMDMDVIPSVTFTSVNGVVTSLTQVDQGWDNSRTFGVIYDVTDDNLELEEINAVVSGFYDVSGNLGTTTTYTDSEFDIDLNKASVVSVDITNSNIYEELAIDVTTVIIGVDYDEPMDQNSNPSITFTDNASNSLVFESGEWTSSTRYEASYIVNDNDVETDDVDATVSGALDLAGNTQEIYNANDLFDIDLVKPVVSEYAISVNPINESNVGAASVTFTVEFSEDMDTGTTPILTYEPAFTSSSLNSGSWNGSNTYTFVYDIADDDLEISDVSLTITVAEDVAGNIISDDELIDVFDVDLRKPEVDVLSFNTNLINESNVGENEFSVTIEFDEDMDTDVIPSVTFTSENGEVTSLVFASSGWNNSRTFVADYDVTDDNLELEEINAVVSGFVDVAGNTGTTTTYTDDEFEIDLAAPMVVLLNMSHTNIYEDLVLNSTTVTIDVTYSEEMDENSTPSITFTPDVSDEVSFVAGAWTGGTLYSASYTIFDTNLESFENDVFVSSAMDFNGNTQDIYSESNVFDVDLLQPTIVNFSASSTFINPTVTSVSFTIAYSEDMNNGIDPTLSFEDNPSSITLNSTNWNSNTFTAEYTVTDDNLEQYFVDVAVNTAEDVAGNIMASASYSNFLDIDLVEPTILSIAPSSQTITDATDGDNTVYLDIVFSEDMNQTIKPSITYTSLEDWSASLEYDVASSSWATSTTFRAYFDVDKDGETDIDAADIVVSGAEDLTANAMNSSTQTNFFDIDTENPTFTIQYHNNVGLSSVMANNLVLQLGDAKFIEVVPSESLDFGTTPQIAIDAQGTANDVNATNLSIINSFKFRLSRTAIAFDDATDGSVREEIAITGRDIYGNYAEGTTVKGLEGSIPTNIDPKGAFIDATPPTFTIEYFADASFTQTFTDSPRLKAGTYYIKITSNEALADRPYIDIENTENSAFDVDEEQITLPNVVTAGTVFRYPRTIAASPEVPGETKELIRITGTDENNNTVTLTFPTNTFTKAPYIDTKKPVATVTFEEAIINSSTLTQIAYITYDEDMDQGTTPTVNISGSNWVEEEGSGGSWINSQIYSYTFTHSGFDETNTSATISVATTSGAMDLAGNTDIGDVSDEFIIDTDDPEIIEIFAVKNYEYKTLINSEKLSQVFLIVFDEDMEQNSAPGADIFDGFSFNSDELSYTDGEWLSSTTYSLTFTHSGIEEDVVGNPDFDNDYFEVFGTDLHANYVDAKNTNGNETFYIDTDLPSVTSVSLNTSTITLAETSSTLTITINYDEEMDISGDNDPTIQFSNDLSGALSFISGSWDDETEDAYTAHYLISDAQLDLDNTITILNARDNNFNLQNQYNVPETLYVDQVKPSATVTFSENEISLNNLTQVVTVTYNEAMHDDGSPLIDYSSPNWIDIGGDWVNDMTYTHTFTHDGTEETDNSATFTVGDNSGATDFFGNPDIGDISDYFTIDTDRPSITTATFSEAPMGTYTDNITENSLSYTLSVYYDEDMDTNSEPGFSAESSYITFYNGIWASSVQFDVDVIHNGDVENDLSSVITIIAAGGATDVIGNEALSSTTVSLIIDTDKPDVASVSYSSGTINEDHTIFTITVNYNEDMNTDVNPDIEFSSDISSVITFDEGEWVDADTYVATYEVTDAGLDIDDIEVTISEALDFRGNMMESHSPVQLLFIDQVDPTAKVKVRGRNATASKTAYKSGDEVLITVTTNEPMSVAPSITISGANTLAASSTTLLSGNVFTYEYTVGAGDGTATIALSLGADLGGNVMVGTPTDGGTFVVDNTAPTLVQLILDNEENSPAKLVSSESLFTNDDGTGSTLNTEDFGFSSTGGNAELNEHSYENYPENVSVSMSGTNQWFTFFDNDDHLDVDKVTIELWFNQDLDGVKFLTAKASENLEIHTISGQGIRFIPTNNVYFDTDLGVYGLNEWTHLAVVYDPANSYHAIYINGDQVNTTKLGANPVTTTIPITESNFVIGARGNGDYPFDGFVDEVRVWSDVRTDEEIYANKNIELTGNEAGLVFYYNFNDAGTNVEDLANGIGGAQFTNMSFGGYDIPMANSTTMSFALDWNGPFDGDEFVEASAANNTSVFDAAGNALLISSVASTFTYVPPYIVDLAVTTTDATTNSGTTYVNATSSSNDEVSIKLEYHKTVNVTGTPRIELNTTPTRYAEYASGNGSKTLTFVYEVQENDMTIDNEELNWTSTNALELDGGTIKGTDNLNAKLNLTNDFFDEDIAENYNIIVDAVAPQVTIDNPLNSAFVNGTGSLSFTITDENPAATSQATIGGVGFASFTSGNLLNTVTNWGSAGTGVNGTFVFVKHIDLAGNETVNTIAVTKDVTPAALSGLSDNGADQQKQGDVVTITFDGTDANGISGNPTVNVHESGGSLISAAVFNNKTGDTYTYDYTVPSGDYADVRVVVVATDVATNVSSSTITEAFTIDNTPPAIIATNDDGTFESDGNIVDINIEATDANDFDIDVEVYTSANVSLGTADFNSENTNTFNYSYEVGADDYNNVKIVFVATDLAGNVSSSTISNAFNIDNTAPELVITAPSNGVVTNGTTSLTYDLEEANPTNTLAKVGAGAFNNFTSGSAISSINGWGGLAEGSATVTLQHTDLAGNETNTYLELIKDTEGPEFDNLSDNGSTYVKNGDEVTITFDLVEANDLMSNPSVTITNDDDEFVALADFTGSIGNSYTYTFEVSAGNYEANILVNATDEAGNVGTLATLNDAFIVDNSAPLIAGVNDGGATDVNEDATVTINVEASDDISLDGNPTVTIYSNDGASNLGSGSFGSLNTGTYTYSFDVPAGDYEDVQIVVDAMDLAGNMTSSTLTNAFTIDNTAPMATIALINDNPTSADQVTFKIALSETVVSFTTANVEVFNTLPSGVTSTFTSIGSNSYTVVVTANNTADNGGIWISLDDNEVYDAAGNELANPGSSNTYSISNDFPTIVSADLDETNGFIIVEFSAGVYGDAFATDPVESTDFNLVFNQNGGTATNAVIASLSKLDDSPLEGNETFIKVNLNVTGTPNGSEYIVIAPASNFSIFSAGGSGVETSESSTVTLFDKVAPSVSAGGSLEANNAYVDITFSEGVYGESNGTGAIVASDLSLTFTANGGNATAATISTITKTNSGALTGGESTIRVNLNITGTPSGDETISIGFAGSDLVYDINGNSANNSTNTGAITLNDKLAPTVAFTYPTASTTVNGSYHTAFTHNDQTATYYASVNGGTNWTTIVHSGNGTVGASSATLTNISSIAEFAGLGQGAFTLSVAGVDGNNNTSSTITLSLSKDTEAPVATFSPASGATSVSPTANITITFDGAVVKADGSAIDNTNVDDLVELRLTNSGGSPVAFDATIDGNVITIDPTTNLTGSTVYWAALKNNVVGDAVGNLTSLTTTTFTTSSTALTEIETGTGTIPSTVSSLQDTEGERFNALFFNVVDDKADNSIDVTPTLISGITFNRDNSNDQTSDWTNVISGAKLTDGTNSINASSITSNSIVFSGFDTGVGELGYVGDNATKAYTLQIWLISTPSATIDNKKIVITLANTSVSTTGTTSSMRTSGVSDLSSGTSNLAITVTGTELRFVQQPATVTAQTNFASSVTVAITDANGNRDLDATNSISMSSSAGIHTGGTASAVSGLATFGSLQMSSFANSTTLLASNNDVSSATSNAFTVNAGVPSAPSAFSTSVGSKKGAIKLSWTNSRYAMVLVKRASNTPNSGSIIPTSTVTDYISNGVSYSALSGTNYNGLGATKLTTALATDTVKVCAYDNLGSVSGYEVEGMDGGVTYHFRIISFDGDLGNASSLVYNKTSTLAANRSARNYKLSVDGEEVELPENGGEFYVSPISPNPVSNDLKFDITSDADDLFTVEIYNSAGEKITTLAEQTLISQGSTKEFRASLNQMNIAAGSYTVFITTVSGSVHFNYFIYMP